MVLFASDRGITRTEVLSLTCGFNTWRASARETAAASKPGRSSAVNKCVIHRRISAQPCPPYKLCSFLRLFVDPILSVSELRTAPESKFDFLHRIPNSGTRPHFSKQTLKGN